MKNFLFSFVLLILALVSCNKQDNVIPASHQMGKMSLPQVSLIQGTELITKAADFSVNKITYEFWVKSGSNWVLAEDGLFKDGTTSQNNNKPIWTVDYPNECSTCFIEVPLGMQTRIVAKVMKGTVIKFYGIFETPETGFVHNGNQIALTQMKAYEINSRLRLDVSDLIKNTNFNFVFTFHGTLKNVDYSNIVQSASTSWMFTGNARTTQLMPLENTGMNYDQIFSILGKNHPLEAPDYKLGTSTFPAINITTVGTKTYYEIYEFFGQGSNDCTVTYSITRKSDNKPIKTNVPITAVGPASGFASNWLQAGYNYTITLFADPQDLGNGCFTTTLIYNTEVNGTVNL